MNTHSRLALGLVYCGLFFSAILGGKVKVVLEPSGGFMADLLSAGSSLVAHHLVSLFFLAGILVYTFREKVIALPSRWVLFPLIAFLVVVQVSILFSRFPFASFQAWHMWVNYAFALLAVVTTCGRGKPLIGALIAWFLGVVVVAAWGIQEYGTMRALDPSWRIFSTYMNPNVLAGILGMAVPVALSLVCLAKEGVMKIAAVAGSLVVVLALALTQSKGGYLACGIGVVGWLVLLPKPNLKQNLGWSAGTLIACLLLMAAVLSANTKPTASSFGRVAGASQQSEQSVGFRRLLWKAAFEGMKASPLGYGPGTFRYESGRSGIVPRTVLAHQSYLQIGFENGALGLLAFLGLIAGALRAVSAGFRSLSVERRLILTAAIGSLATACAHNFVDSDLFHFGTGIAFFALLGVALLASADGAGAEILTTGVRRIAIWAPTTAIALLSLWTLTMEHKKATWLNSDLSAENLAKETALAGPDPEVSFILAARSTVPESSRYLKDAIQRGPTSRNYRLLMNQTQDSAEFVRLGEQHLRQDPFDLDMLGLMVERMSSEEGWGSPQSYLERMIEIEQSTVVQVRAVPEIVVTEVHEARIQFALSDHCPEGKKKKLLSDAIEGMDTYLKVTARPAIETAKRNKSAENLIQDWRRICQILNEAQFGLDALGDDGRGTTRFGDARDELSALAAAGG